MALKMSGEGRIRSVGNREKNIYSLKFAYDLALIADYHDGLSEMLKTLENYVVKNSLENNVKK